MHTRIVLLMSVIAIAGCSTSASKEHAVKSASVHTQLAGLYYERTQYGIAMDEISQALDADSDYAPAYSVRGLIHMSLHEDKDAEADFKKSLSLDRNDSNTHNNYGWFLCQRGRENESIAEFLAAIKDPMYATPGVAYLNAGLCSSKGGNKKEADDFLHKALQVQPDLTQAMYALADLNFANGDIYMANRYFTNFAKKTDTLTSEQLWLGVRISRKTGDRGLEASYATQLRNRYPDSREAQQLMHGE